MRWHRASFLLQQCRDPGSAKPGIFQESGALILTPKSTGLIIRAPTKRNPNLHSAATRVIRCRRRQRTSSRGSLRRGRAASSNRDGKLPQQGARFRDEHCKRGAARYLSWSMSRRIAGGHWYRPRLFLYEAPKAVELVGATTEWMAPSM